MKKNKGTIKYTKEIKEENRIQTKQKRNRGDKKWQMKQYHSENTET